MVIYKENAYGEREREREIERERKRWGGERGEERRGGGRRRRRTGNREPTC